MHPVYVYEPWIFITKQKWRWFRTCILENENLSCRKRRNVKELLGKSEWLILGWKRTLWFSEFFPASLILVLGDEVSPVTQRCLSIISVRILINTLVGLIAQRGHFVLREKAAVVRTSRQQRWPSYWDHVWMDDTFNFTPQQRWSLASTTSNQFCRSYFVAKNWFAASPPPAPFWKPNFPSFCWCHQLRQNSWRVSLFCLIEMTAYSFTD